jgi:hypothetical protein
MELACLFSEQMLSTNKHIDYYEGDFRHFGVNWDESNIKSNWGTFHNQFGAK